MYVHPYVMASTAGHSYHVWLLPPRVPFTSFIEQICPAARQCLGDADRGRGEERLLRLAMKESPHCMPTHYYLAVHPTMLCIHLVYLRNDQGLKVALMFGATNCRDKYFQCKGPC